MKKVCIIATSLGNGGAERFSALLSEILVNLDYDVHILITKNTVDYKYSGALFSLHKKIGGSYSFFKKLEALKFYFRTHNFDFIIDNRPRTVFVKEYILYKHVFKAKHIISVVHSYYLKNYMPTSKFLAKILYKNNSGILAVSKEIQKEIVSKYKFENCFQIYNPVDIDTIEKVPSDNKKINQDFIIFYGRIEESVKNFSLLLSGYKKSILCSQNIKLYIVGDGDDVEFVNTHISDLQLDNYVKCLPYLENPFHYVKNALFTVLTSKHEGFPMVLIESLACETPVVSVDCKSGPKEIIEHLKNGLLVENYNVSALAKAFDSFVEDQSLYRNCKANSKLSVQKFSIKNISKEWNNLLKSMS